MFSWIPGFYTTVPKVHAVTIGMQLIIMLQNLCAGSQCLFISWKDKMSSHCLGTDRLMGAVTDPDIPCADCVLKPKSTCCVRTTSQDPNSELTLAQTSQRKLAGHNDPGYTTTSSHRKQPRKQSELLSRPILSWQQIWYRLGQLV